MANAETATPAMANSFNDFIGLLLSELSGQFLVCEPHHGSLNNSTQEECGAS
jgi:hypothetical protein